MPGWLLELFTRFGYAAVFVGLLLENAGVPVPGETVLLAGAALARFGRLSLIGVIVTAIVGATLGDNIGFWIGRRGGRLVVERHGGKIGITRGRLAEFDRFFERHGAKTVFIARFVTGLRVIGAVLAGGSRLPWSTFLVFNFAGATVWATTIALAGYGLAHSWNVLERLIGRGSVLALILVAVVAMVAIRRSKREV